MVFNSKLGCFLRKGIVTVKGFPYSGEGRELSVLQTIVTSNYVPAAAYLSFPGRHRGSVAVRAAPPLSHLTLTILVISNIN